MNEKFNQLLQTATAEVDSTISEEEWLTYIHDNAIQAKFAELIVLECSSIAYKNFDNGDLIAGLLMQHFGVEC